MLFDQVLVEPHKAPATKLLSQLTIDTSGVDACGFRVAKFEAIDLIEAGNASAHRGYVPLRADLEALLDVVERLVKDCYLLPRRAEQIKASTPERLHASPDRVEPALSTKACGACATQ